MSRSPFASFRSFYLSERFSSIPLWGMQKPAIQPSISACEAMRTAAISNSSRLASPTGGEQTPPVSRRSFHLSSKLCHSVGNEAAPSTLGFRGGVGSVQKWGDYAASADGGPRLDTGPKRWPNPNRVRRCRPNSEPGAESAPRRDRVGDDLPIVWRVVARAESMRRQQGVLAHQPQQPFARDPNAVHHPQPRPNLAMSLAMPERTGEIGADRRQQSLVGYHGLRSTTLCRNWRRRVGPMPVSIGCRSA